jgi:hypothetical protein
MLRFNGSGGFDFLGHYKESKEQFEQMSEYLKNFRQSEIVDFDDHFLDADMDWRNNFIN